MSGFDVELVLTSKRDAQPIRNLYPLYLHDIASYEHKPPNRHGVLHKDDDVRTWDELDLFLTLLTRSAQGAAALSLGADGAGLRQYPAVVNNNGKVIIDFNATGPATTSIPSKATPSR